MFLILSLEGVCGRRREETKAVRGEATPAGAIWQMQHALEVLRKCTEAKRLMITSDDQGANVMMRLLIKSADSTSVIITRFMPW